MLPKVHLNFISSLWKDIVCKSLQPQEKKNILHGYLYYETIHNQWQK